MPDVRVAPAPIPQMAPLAFEQIIIAGGDDDVSAGDLFDWVAPLLAGIPGGRWMSCEIDILGFWKVMYCTAGRMASLRLDASSPIAIALLDLLPEAASMTLILLSDFTSQALTLLDSIARWLSIHDTDDASLAPVLCLLGGFQPELSHARQDRRAPG